MYRESSAASADPKNLMAMAQLNQHQLQVLQQITGRKLSQMPPSTETRMIKYWAVYVVV